MDVEKFLGWAEGKGWTVERRTVPLSLPKIITDRYEIPGLYKEFLEKALLCSGPMDTEWFLCEEGYRQDDPDAIRWNECEQISLEAARDLSDQEEERRVTQFWDGVLPFFLSVGSGYEYYGFDLLGRFGPAGGILHGFEPMFEEAERFAPDFPAFLDKVAAGEVATGGVLFDPEEYAFMEIAGRKEQERLERESAQALRSLLHPEEEHCHDHGDGCGCDHDHH